MSLLDTLLPLANDAVLWPASPLRTMLLREAHGRVLELGVGSGLNLAHYPPAAVERVLAVEPSEPMWRVGRRRARAAPFAVERVDAQAEALPLPDASIDVAVSTFVLCSVHDPARALGELARVVRPGGALLLLEHVQHPDRWTRRAQQWVTPAWSRCFRGCHPGRDLITALAAAGWVPRGERTVRLWWLPRVVEHHLFGFYENRSR